MMIKNSLICFILTILHFPAQTQVKNTQPNNTENVIVETTDRELIHLITGGENKTEIIKQLPNLYTQNLKKIYKFTNLTPHRALVKYANDKPFLRKGHELKSGKCLYIHRNDFNYLTIIQGSELLCSSNKTNKTSPCQPMDYTLDLISQQQIFTELPLNLHIDSLKGYYEFSYIKNSAVLSSTYGSNINFEESPYLILLHKDSSSTEECETF